MPGIVRRTVSRAKQTCIGAATCRAGARSPLLDQQRLFPRHEPVRGFGTIKSKPATATEEEIPVARVASSPPPPPPPDEGPPPGTPPEFLGMPVIPPKRKKSGAAVDPEKLAKLKQKMREQGMLPPEE